MTTITINQNVNFTKLNFSDFSELFDYLISNFNDDFQFIDFSNEEQNILDNRSKNIKNTENDILNILKK